MRPGRRKRWRSGRLATGTTRYLEQAEQVKRSGTVGVWEDDLPEIALGLGCDWILGNLNCVGNTGGCRMGSNATNAGNQMGVMFQQEVE